MNKRLLLIPLAIFTFNISGCGTGLRPGGYPIVDTSPEPSSYHSEYSPTSYGPSDYSPTPSNQGPKANPSPLVTTNGAPQIFEVNYTDSPNVIISWTIPRGQVANYYFQECSQKTCRQFLLVECALPQVNLANSLLPAASPSPQLNQNQASCSLAKNNFSAYTTQVFQGSINQSSVDTNTDEITLTLTGLKPESTEYFYLVARSYNSFGFSQPVETSPY